MTRITLPYTPRPLQRQVHELLDRRRWAVLICHRRFGKTVLLINQLIKKALTHPLPDARFAYLTPYLKQAKMVAWDYLKYYTRTIPRISYNEAELRADFPNGARVRLFGADNMEGQRGIYLDGCVLDEYGHMDPRIFTSILRPALSDREGWAVFSGTPNGRNHLFDIYTLAQANPQTYLSLLLKASETGVLPEDELADARELMSAEEYAREYECSFDGALVGSYYAASLNQAESEQRVGRVPYAPELPVVTSWDLGVGDATGIWFMQPFQQEIRVLRYYEAEGEGLPYYAKVLRDFGYHYGSHIMPHDVRVRELGTGKSRYETAESLGIRPVTIARSLPVDDGIQATRLLLSRCWFDRANCQQGLAALYAYHKEYDEARKEYKARPYHDWSSHAADALRYFAVGYAAPVAKRSVSSLLGRWPAASGWV